MNNTDETNAEPLDVNRHVRELLAKHHRIAAIWCTADVLGVRPHLTEEQAWKVLEQVGDRHDPAWGICWITLETVADDLFPNPERKRGQP
jgi:hypothetical protein